MRALPTMSRLARQVACALAMSLAAGRASAVTCTLSTGGLPFPAYSVFNAAATTGNATITLTCSLQPTDSPPLTVNYVMSLSTGSSNSYVQRTLKIPTDQLGYNIYTSNTYSVVWGDGNGGSSSQSGSIKLTNGQPSRSENKTAYGRIPALQDVSVSNSYADNITVTVTY
jgi:spore coat protein U-like protein